MNAEDADDPDGKGQKKDGIGSWLEGPLGAIVFVLIVVFCIFFLFHTGLPREIFEVKSEIKFFKYCEKVLIAYIDGSYKAGVGAGFAGYAGNNHPGNISMSLNLPDLDSTKVEAYGVHYFLHMLYFSSFYSGQLVVIRTDCQATLNAFWSMICGKGNKMKDFHENLWICAQHFFDVRFEKVEAHSEDELINLVDRNARETYGLLENTRKRPASVKQVNQRQNPKKVYVKGKQFGQKQIEYKHQTDFVQLLQSE